MMVARVLNLITIILELVAFSKCMKGRSLKQAFKYYTQLSNMVTFVAALFLVIFGDRRFVRVIRFLSVTMLIMTFFVTTFILVPASGKVKELLFSGSGLYQHLLVPALSTSSYLLAEGNASAAWLWLPCLVTLFYGIIMLYLNYEGRVDGPYPFFRIRAVGAAKTTLYMLGLLIVIGSISLMVLYFSGY